MQTEAQGQLQAAEVRQKGLKKQLAEQRKALASKEKEAGGLAQDLQKEQRKVDECSRRQALSQKSLDTHLRLRIAASPFWHCACSLWAAEQRKVDECLRIACCSVCDRDITVYLPFLCTLKSMPKV